jgi:dynein heavy chain, axonemal
VENRWKTFLDAVPSIFASPRFDLRSTVGDPTKI